MPVVAPGAHEAQAALALVQLAEARADVALHAAVVEPMPVAAGVPVMTSALVAANMTGPVAEEARQVRIGGP